MKEIRGFAGLDGLGSRDGGEWEKRRSFPEKTLFIGRNRKNVYITFCIRRIAIMKLCKKNLAAQLYTIREYTKTPKDIAESMKKIKAIGYDAVQISGLGPIDNKELLSILDGEGLVCCASHDSAAAIVDKTDEIIERLQALKCPYTAYPYPHVQWTCEEDCLKLAAALNEAGARFKAAGITLCYHNHALEFEKFNGRTVLDILYSASTADNLKGEPDTYWVQQGGANPVSWIRKLSGRMPLLHLKDSGFRGGKQIMMEIGSGNLEWKPILDAADEAGCLWYIVEQDICPASPFDSLKMSYDYLSENFF